MLEKRRSRGDQTPAFPAMTPSHVSTDDSISASNHLLTAALLYAAEGYAVFPLKPKSKEPITSHGVKDATTDRSQIESWWSQHPDANIGLAVGQTGVVIDVDPRNDGHVTLLALEAKYGKLPETKVHITGSDDGSGNSRHLFFRVPADDVPSIRGKLGPGVDVKKVGGYVVAPPSLHPDTGRQYVNTSNGHMPVLLTGSPWMQALLKQKPNHVVSQRDTIRASRDHPYVQSAIRDELYELATCPDSGGRHNGRNNALRDVAISLGRFACVDRDWLRSQLVQCMEANGYVASDGMHKVERTINNAFRFADSQPERTVPPRDEWANGSGLDFDPDDDGQQTSQSGREHVRHIQTIVGTGVKSKTAEYVWSYQGVGSIQRGTLCLFGGRPGAGKSTASRWFAAGFTRGDLEGCWKGKPQRIAYVGSEESLEYTLIPGLRAAGADLTCVLIPDLRDERGQPMRLLSDRDELLLTEWLRAQNVTVVVVDPLMSTISGKADINRNNEVRAFVEPWARIAQRIDGVVIGVTHLTKAQTGDVVAGINGSSAFGEVARSVFGFIKDPDSDDGLRVMSQAKNSTGPETIALLYRIESVLVQNDDGGQSNMARFVMLGDSDRSVGDILRGGMDHADDDAVLWLREYLTLNGRSASRDVKRDAHKEAGHSEATIKRAAGKLHILSERVGFPAITYWSLCPEPQSAHTHAQAEPTESTEPWGDFSYNNNACQGPPPQSAQLAQPTCVEPPGEPTVEPTASAAPAKGCKVCGKPCLAGQGNVHLSCKPQQPATKQE